ncbi:MAG: UbiA-like polyprenyltransferase [Acidobacteriota bacterium]
MLSRILSDIKIAHTLFALPMALTGMLLATGGHLPSARVLTLILLCMATGRSAAMGFNRLIDAAIDAKNPRTASRPIPAGALSSRAMAAFVGINVVLFLAGAALCNGLTLALAPIALAFFVLYPYTKRFTALCHFVLGTTLAAAPVGAWIAVRGSVDAVPLLLGAAVLLWVSGFDILYALQDEAFDRAHGLHSVPVALGRRRARIVARLLHGAMAATLLGVGLAAGLGIAYVVSVFACAALLFGEHRLVRGEDLSRLNVAFFTLNSWLSVVLFAGTAIDRLLAR